jgi:hypothetical protein
MKKFFISDRALISQHKMRKTIAGFGLLHKDQELVLYSTRGKEYKFGYQDIKVGGHDPKVLVYLAQNETITKIDIVTKVPF